MLEKTEGQSRMDNKSRSRHWQHRVHKRQAEYKQTNKQIKAQHRKTKRGAT